MTAWPGDQGPAETAGLRVPPGAQPPVEVPGHQAPPRRLARIGSRLGVGVLVLAALAVGGPLAALRPTSDVRERPFVQQGGFGELASVRTFEATVVSVRGAAKVSQRGRVYDTAGVWVLVRVRLSATDEATTVNYAALRDERERSHQQTARLEQPLTSSSRTLQPGIPVEGEIVFEVPRDTATRLWLRLAQPVLDRRMDAMAEVPLLPVPRSTIDRWSADPAPAVVTPAKVGPP
ncbi:DUF4352 domain-containing protein [Plantactinospora sp. S1510]|uniref:DUF4352 domain-containing protein n=1 Tax=Plantactinospora alkalitolerans TaxID=2789879 RepID=A0ABS0GN39_9ACTN|nr:DUF4352 domain-containing protein [Plantactinospora alkalitolerans]MBF9127597.1 DUF4352 domain-containing protein [Plantactinospora alkalitolerans]